VVTDPPFNVGFDYGTGYNDRRPIAEYGAWLRTVIAETQRLVRPGGWSFWWMAMRHCHAWHDWFPPGWRIFAAAKNFAQFRPTDIQFSWDPVIFWQNGPGRRHAFAGKRDWHVANNAAAVLRTAEAHWHPCRRPLDTVSYLVSIATEPDDVILDPFAGSGTTLVAAQALGRRAIGVEIEERYCRIAVERLRQQPLPLPEPEPVRQPALMEEDS